MGASSETDDNVYKKFQELCRTLNMDTASARQAWDSYESIRQNYSLEGEPMHWLGCALYVACRKAKAPIVGRPGTIVEGNFVSLTSLLRLCSLSLSQFFNKIKKWQDMTDLPSEFVKKTEALENNFAVSYLTFMKFVTVYEDIFIAPAYDQQKQPLRSRKQRNMPCTPAKVFEFCWIMFVYVKGRFTQYSNDLVNSCNLLLACCDLAYNNIMVLNDRKTFLNPKFPGYSEDETPAISTVCILDMICKRHDGIPSNTKYVEEYTLKVHMKTLFAEGILHGDSQKQTGLFDPGNFDDNLKSIIKAYEGHVLKVGDFDEKIFLAEYKRKYQVSKQNPDMRLLNQNTNEVQCIAPSTPLTGRNYLRDGRDNSITPLATATQSIAKLQALLAGRSPDLSESLINIFKECSRDPTETVKGHTRELGNLFCNEYIRQSADQQSASEFARRYLDFGVTLFYKILESLLEDEKVRKPNLDLSFLLEQELFHDCLFACSLEIILHSYNSPHKFPWILNTLNLKPFHFYRVIELIIRSKNQLSRDVVKHLSMIEEQILESRAWQSDSALWDSIQDCNFSIPSCEDTSIPGQKEIGMQNTKNVSNVNTCYQSPGASASERFQSPVVINSAVKKRLFPTTTSQAVLPGQSVLTNTVSKVAVIVNSQDNDSTSTENGSNSGNNEPATQEAAKPKRSGSFSLFFRKFYRVAGARLEDLCNQLEIRNVELRKKIWTCFENAIMNNIYLMKDRHLDQILMCTVYIMCKVTSYPCDFLNIMRCYRSQPQAVSNVYRNVLIKERKTKSSNVESIVKIEPDENEDLEEKRGDLIEFYNTVFRQEMKSFALQFSTNSQQNGNILLSPLPSLKSQPVSPKRRVTENLFVHPLDSLPPLPSPNNQLKYVFSRSPSKDLQNINLIISGHNRGKKRLLIGENENEHPPPTKIMARKIQGLLEDRKGQFKE